MSKFNYLTIDTETGGVPFNEVSLLTVYLGLFDENFKFVSELDLKLRPNDGIYHIRATGMEINKINLVEHESSSITYKTAGTLVYNFINQWMKNSGEKLIPVGHNVYGDIAAIKHNLISDGSWGIFVSYRCIDTCSTAQLLRVMGKLPQDLECSLDSLIKYFNLEATNVGNLHEAKYDALMTIKVLEKLIELIGPPKRHIVTALLPKHQDCACGVIPDDGCQRFPMSDDGSQIIGPVAGDGSQNFGQF